MSMTFKTVLRRVHALEFWDTTQQIPNDCPRCSRMITTRFAVGRPVVRQVWTDRDGNRTDYWRPGTSRRSKTSRHGHGIYCWSCLSKHATHYRRLRDGRWLRIWLGKDDRSRVRGLDELVHNIGWWPDF